MVICVAHERQVDRLRFELRRIRLPHNRNDVIQSLLLARVGDILQEFLRDVDCEYGPFRPHLLGELPRKQPSPRANVRHIHPGLQLARLENLLLLLHDDLRLRQKFPDLLLPGREADLIGGQIQQGIQRRKKHGNPLDAQKLKACRDHDLVDTQSIVHRQGTRLDLDYLWRWADRLGLQSELHYVLSTPSAP